MTYLEAEGLASCESGTTSLQPERLAVIKKIIIKNNISDFTLVFHPYFPHLSKSNKNWKAGLADFFTHSFFIFISPISSQIERMQPLIN